MKKSLLIIGLLASTSFAFAQKADTVKKAVPPVKEYKPDPNRVYNIPLALTEIQVSLLIASPEDWKALKVSKNTGEEITVRENMADEIRKNIKAFINAVKQDDYNKWLAGDTVKAAPGALKNVKKVKRVH